MVFSCEDEGHMFLQNLSICLQGYTVKPQIYRPSPQFSFVILQSLKHINDGNEVMYRNL
jgi:hypothetical protein